MRNKNRLFVTYQVKASKNNINDVAYDICLEQTVEVTEGLAQDKWIKENIIGKIEEITQTKDNTFKVVISYGDEIIGYQLPQFLNVLHGNISLKKCIKVVDINLSSNFLSHFSGPRFGIKSLRKILNVFDRPLLATALKPMGKSPEEFSHFSYKLALGGIDIIKDDHGLINHAFCHFKERVKLCQQAINKAKSKTGKNVLYFPNITDCYENMIENIKWAKEMNVGGILVIPMIVGLDYIRYLVDNDLGLPIMTHPAFMGSLFNANHGISHRVMLGDITRMVGADLVIYPNFGGRFPFTKKICHDINYALKKKIFNFKQSFSVPAGGIDIKNISKLKKFYGNDVVFLIGSDLYAYSNNLTENVKYFLGKLK